MSQKKRNPHYVFAEIIIYNNVIIIDSSLMNLIFLCLWDFILFVQYNKSKQNKLKVLSYTNFVFNAYIIICAVFLGHPVVFRVFSYEVTNADASSLPLVMIYI